MHFWEIRVDVEGREVEVIRGLTEVQKLSLMEIFRKEGIQATATEYNAGNEPTGREESVN